MTCSACGYANAEGQRFCGQCGTPLTVSCRECGASNPPDHRFCGQCGAALGAAEAAAAPAAPAASAPAAERRLVSVLFADLVGFTTLSESRDAEEVRELLSRYFETSRRLIEVYGGNVEKFIGDAVMAVWGTPVATEDDAERAVRAALDLVAAVSALGDEVGAPELRARAGVLTGEAAVTIGAEGQGMVAGDLVNTASRVQSVAEPGAVFVGEGTRRATEQTIVYEDAGSFELKGKEGLTPLWKAQRVVSGLRGALKSQGLEAPFVGRDRELRLVKELFHACADEKKAHLVSVTGIAGIGKSRLAWEFYKYFDGIADTVYWHRGRCLSYGEGVTYWALADMVRMRCRIAEDEEPASAQAKLRATLDEHILDGEERAFLEPRLAHLLGLEERSRWERHDLFAAWRVFFERLAEQYPTVLAFEDMQWADTSLLEFVEHLLEWSRKHPIFVVTLARPELADRRPTWGAGQRNFTSLYLEPLSRDAMNALLDGLVPGLPTRLREQILERAEGVPLYAVETVRMLLDRGLLVEDGAVYRMSGEIEALEVPETLQALIAARLDGLSSEERRLLQDGAVLGKTFTKAAAEAVSELRPAELDALLSSLVRKEVLGVQSDPRSPEHGQYGFLQDLVRHVAYEMLSKRERKLRHLTAARHLESAFADLDEIAEVLASHYIAAFDAAPDADDAEEIRTRARDTLTRAGERASALAANEEAQRYFEQAAALSDGLERAYLRERAGAAANGAGNFDDAQSHLSEALLAWEAAGDTHAAARVATRLGEAEWQTGKLETALERLETAFEVLSRDGAGADVAELAAQLAKLHYFDGALEIANARAEVALELAETLWLPELLAEALITKGLILDSGGRTEEALALHHHGVRLALEHDLPTTALRGYINLSATLNDHDRYEEALALGRRGLELAPRSGSRVAEAHLYSNTSEALLQTGRWDEAIAIERETEFNELSHLVNGAWILLERGQLEEAKRIATEHPLVLGAKDVQDRSYSFVVQSGVLRAEGRLVEALAMAEDALTAAQSIKANLTRGAVETLECAFALGRFERVEELLAWIESLPRGERRPSLTAHAARYRARIAVARGIAEDVDSGFHAAIALFRELGVVFWLAVTELEHAEWLVSQGRVTEAEELLRDAHETFERLRAQPWLERLERVAPQPAEVLA